MKAKYNVEDSFKTLKKYKDEYLELIIEYNAKTKNRTIKDFIKKEIKYHSDSIDDIKQQSIIISDFDYRRIHFDPIEKDFGSQEKFLEMMLYFERRIASNKAIINFLKTEKLAIDITTLNK